MPRTELSLKTLHLYGRPVGGDTGKIEAAWDRELQSVLQDIDNRPDDKKSRTVTLTVEITPKETTKEGCATVGVDFKIGSKIPARRSRDNEMRFINHDGLCVAYFHDESVEAPLFAKPEEKPAAPAPVEAGLKVVNG